MITRIKEHYVLLTTLTAAVIVYAVGYLYCDSYLEEHGATWMFTSGESVCVVPDTLGYRAAAFVCAPFYRTSHKEVRFGPNDRVPKP